VDKGDEKIPEKELIVPKTESSNRFLSMDNVGKIGRLLRLVLMAPVILIVGVASIPVCMFERRIMRQREKRFAADMKTVGRLVSWIEARSQIDNERGTLIEESVSPDGYRLWWTSEDIPTVSPYPCCFEDGKIPDVQVYRPFFEWCRFRFTNPESGTAQLIDLAAVDGKDATTYLCTDSAAHRRVRIHRPEAQSASPSLSR
jgi:hypothetical protein